MYKRAGDFSTFKGLGLARREVFGHVAVLIPKAYPASQVLLERRGMTRRLLQAGKLFQLNLYTTDFFGLPDELFWEPEINWHHQQFGAKGLIAVAGLWIRQSEAIIAGLQSDLCQQLYRHSGFNTAYRTRVDRHFRYWYAILLNAVLDFCTEFGILVLYSPTGRQIVANINKPIAPDLFFKIYDYPEGRFVCRRTSHHNAEYWEIPLCQNAARIGRLREPEPTSTGGRERPEISIFHDIEENIDTSVSPDECAANLDRMLQIESDFGLNGNYDVLGRLWERKRNAIQQSNPQHSLSFHSFNHRIEELSQLPQCRGVDLRVRGYRPPRSQITPELTDYNLTLFDFEWLASSASSLGLQTYKLENGLVKIPIHLDDYPLFTGASGYEDWRRNILQKAREKKFFALGLHDCYANRWLHRYPELLHQLAEVGDFVSADEICARVFLGQRSPPPEAGTDSAHRQPALSRIAGWLRQGS